MNSGRKMSLSVGLVCMIVLIAFNMVYYFNTRSILIRNQEQKVELIANNIKNSIEQSTEGEILFENMIGGQLRTVAIAAQLKLNPDINKVTNEELIHLSTLLDVDEITLFQKKNDDIIGAKSSDPMERNVSSKGWDQYFIAFNQLFDKQNVTLTIGQSLKNYWSGPMDTSSTNPKSINKWGYYYDGTTNYIIDPFVNDTTFRSYQASTGVNTAIQKVLNNNKDIVLEISVLNTNTLLGIKPAGDHPTSPSWYSQRLNLFGAYKYRDAEENYYASLAIANKKSVFYTTAIEGQKILKSFIPLSFLPQKYNLNDTPPVIEIASDYTEIQSTLTSQLQQLVITILICSFLSLFMVFIVLRILNRNKEIEVHSVETVFSENVEILFNSLKEQRHDFANHLSTIHALIKFKQFEELERFTDEVVGSTVALNGIININVPIISALVQAKAAEAIEKKIVFNHNVENMGHLKMETLKATELVKMLGNLIDNAYDAAYNSEEKVVNLLGTIEKNDLKFEIFNTGIPIPDDHLDKIFAIGFTTKSSRGGSGLGLNIVNNLVKQYKGSINVVSNQQGTTFSLVIPLSSFNYRGE